MSWKTILLAISLLASGIGAAHRQEKALFDASAPEKFDGQSWNGLQIDQTTTADIKQQFKTSKGAYRPEAMALPQPPNALANVQVLTDSRGEMSKLVGFRLAYSGAGPDMEQIAGTDEAPERRYPVERYSEWYLDAYPQKGMVAFVATSEVRRVVPLLVLTTPERVKTLLRGLSRQPTPIGDFREKFPERDMVTEFSTIDITFHEDDLHIPEQESLRSAIRERLRRRFSSHLRYARDSAGTLNVTVNVKKPKDKDGYVDAGIALDGVSPLAGKVVTSDSERETFDRGAGGSVNVSHDRILTAFDKALANVERTTYVTVRRRIPKTPEAYRDIVWAGLLNESVR